MNNLLRIKLKFTPEKAPNRPAPRNFTAGRFTDVAKIDSLIDDLNAIKAYYSSTKKPMSGVLVDVCYDNIIPKSNRISALLKSQKNIDKTIVGARFSDAPEGEENHIITHYIDFETIDNTIKNLMRIKVFLIKELNGFADKNNFNEPDAGVDYSEFEVNEKSYIRNLIIDCSVVEKLSVPDLSSIEIEESALITFYKTELKLNDIFSKIFGDSIRYSIYGDNSISVDKDTFNRIKEEIPYLISMVSTDISTLVPSELSDDIQESDIYIPKPKTEPIIGVIDTLYDRSVYFNDWVTYEEVLDEYEKYHIKDENRIHGTEVSSIIVDGPTLNPELDDGCGRFRVKHFGVCVDRISPSRLVRKIKSIVDANPQIHVWNLSLGTEEEVSKNFISYDASILDELQATKNTIFVISGTNDNNPQFNKRLRIGSPADSLNSMVVNSVKRNNEPCTYSRKGRVLSFFNKPDVSYYGGDVKEKLNVYSPKGIAKEMGTSFAAPWISRKLCYLIDVIGLPREVAKALIIDAAAGWEYKLGGYKNKDLIGFGVVPIKIDDILSSDNSEIKFVLYETINSYKTANYAIPVPKNKEGSYPYVARATLCYFPKCRREQGVDYTNRELSLQFGKIKPNGTIDDINKNTQDDKNGHVKERKSRDEFRKWENTKFISHIYKSNRALKGFEDKFWGFSVTSKERFSSPKKDALNFGAVITLKEIKNVNRIEEFKHACALRGYIVSELKVKNQIDIYATSQQDINFD